MTIATHDRPLTAKQEAFPRVAHERLQRVLVYQTAYTRQICSPPLCPWRSTYPKTSPLVERLPEAAWLRARSNPGSRYCQDLPAGQISIRSVLRQRSSSPVAINRNTHRIRIPPAGSRSNRSYLSWRHPPILWTLPNNSLALSTVQWHIIRYAQFAGTPFLCFRQTAKAPR